MLASASESTQKVLLFIIHCPELVLQQRVQRQPVLLKPVEERRRGLEKSRHWNVHNHTEVRVHHARPRISPDGDVGKVPEAPLLAILIFATLL